MDASTLDPAAFEAEMESALGRLETLFPEPSAEAQGDAPVSFSVTDFPAVDDDSPEGQLLALIHEAVTPESEEMVSFGIGDTVSSALDRAREEFESFMERINRDVLNFAHVESGGADSPFAATRVNWTGDATTIFSSGATPGDLRDHAASLRRELLTRNFRLRMFSTVAIAAGKISISLTTPGSALLALPMAYRYVSQLSKQWQALQSLNQH
jgi:hypothetical protein